MSSRETYILNTFLLFVLTGGASVWLWYFTNFAGLVTLLGFAAIISLVAFIKEIIK